MSRYAMCPRCGRRLRRERDAFGNWDGETYVCDWCSSELNEIDDEEKLNVYEAANIWLSNGKDEEYTFGYSEDELEDALK